jgi:hypothetical protein
VNFPFTVDGKNDGLVLSLLSRCVSGDVDQESGLLDRRPPNRHVRTVEFGLESSALSAPTSVGSAGASLYTGAAGTRRDRQGPLDSVQVGSFS